MRAGHFHGFSKSVSAFALLLLAWLAFTYPFSTQQLIAGVAVALVFAVITRNFLFEKNHLKVFSPRIWYRLLSFLGVFVYEEIRSHWNVIRCIFTGRTNFAVVALPVAAEEGFLKTLVANSITMTPGTFTLVYDKYLYIHHLNFDPRSTEECLLDKHGSKIS